MAHAHALGAETISSSDLRTYHLEYVGNPAGDAEIIERSAGLFQHGFQPVHILVEALGLEPSEHHAIHQLLVDWLTLLSGVTADAALADGSANFMVRLEFFGGLLRKACEEGGLKKGARHGGAIETRAACFLIDFAEAVARLPAHERVLGAADVIYFPAPPQTGTFLDSMNAAHLNAAASLRALGQFKAILGAGQYAEIHHIGGGADAIPTTLKQLLTQMPYATVKATRATCDLQDTPAAEQAALVGQWICNNVDPPEPADGIIDIYRVWATRKKLLCVGETTLGTWLAHWRPTGSST